jgi:teichuronic acid biosynthesis glycosyltransferase TuaC
MLRVLSIATLFPNSARPGFGLFVARQAEALAARGDVEMVVVNPIPALPGFGGQSPVEHSYGVDVHRPRFATIPRFGARWNPALIARAVLPLARRLHAEKPFDVVDAQFFYPDGPAAARVAKALSLPLSIKARGSDIHYWGGQAFALRQMLAAAEQAGGLLAVSEALKRDMAALGMVADKIRVHYTGLDHQLFRPLPRQEARALLADQVPPDGKLLVTVGNLIPLKGQHLVIEALASLPDMRLALAGRGPDEAALKTLAAKLGVAERVHFLGSVKPHTMAGLLSAAEIMVLPSQREGLANAWIEALACGTPLVITDVGGAREVVRDDGAGKLVARSSAAIAGAVGELISHPPAQSEVAAHAARFSWATNAATLTAHYRGLNVF